jgi:hypothetical protein
MGLVLAVAIGSQPRWSCLLVGGFVHVLRVVAHDSSPRPGLPRLFHHQKPCGPRPHHPNGRIRKGTCLAVPDRPIRSPVAQDRSAEGVRDPTEPETLGSALDPHGIGNRWSSAGRSGHDWRNESQVTRIHHDDLGPRTRMGPGSSPHPPAASAPDSCPQAVITEDGPHPAVEVEPTAPRSTTVVPTGPATTPSLISVLVSMLVAMKRHDAGCGDARLRCWRIAGRLGSNDQRHRRGVGLRSTAGALLSPDDAGRA